MPEDLLSVVPTRTVIDGVPLYSWASRGQSTIAIMFRVGRADEVFGKMGISHVVEHLALHAVRRAPYPFNGQVSAATTVFTATGSPDQLAEFATAVCASLRSLPLDRFRPELGVLTAESVGRAPDALIHLLSLHCGHDGYGTLNLPEFGLQRLGEKDVASWAAERFTQANAVVWIAGELPPRLRLELPAGRRMPFPEPRVLPDLRTPSCFETTSNAVALSAIRPWTPPLGAAMLAAGERLSETLRYDKGISYRTHAGVTRLTARTVHLVLAADCLRACEDQAAELLVGVLSEISRTGRIAAELDRALQAMRNVYASEQGVQHLLHEWAFWELAGVEGTPVASSVAAMERASPAEIGDAAKGALESSLLVVPRGCTPDIQRFPSHPRQQPSVVAGRKFRHCNAALFQLGRQTNYVVVGRAGVSHADERGEVTTVLFNACAGLLKTSDELRVLIGSDRQVMYLRAQDWRDGHELLTLIDTAVPDDRTVWTSITILN